ncbi:prepilin-type N-terminal cleavage/methylation domain-containing protein [Limnobacter humi]|uniref:Prepilin-type N-terminal cleavage/methylation domain-containing protein n=1 Tax=Limnobacter humi TaxID=1778671 RepID=A0ABT1WII2_9BURK|nr:prepilin-type N-terminal cleavage/methylation domain-containing protein [Limnobacter humi]MCQ8897325.1 prepilin-type N-terminal cleavage/methylation domain-containing protein [Limnobacter humi]
MARNLGFSIIELTIAIAVIAVISAAALPMLTQRGNGQASLAFQVTGVADLLESARTLAVKSTSNTCVRMWNSTVNVGEKQRCVLKAAMFRPSRRDYDLACTEPNPSQNTNDYTVQQTEFSDLSFVLPSQTVTANGQCPTTAATNLLFLGGSGFLMDGQQQIISQQMANTYLYLYSPGATIPGVWTLRVERSGMVSIMTNS